jgi:transcription antitermination factor NusG
MIIEKKDNVTWTPVRTKPRHEKKLVEYCKANNITCYLPLLKSIKRYEKRSVEHYVPMFPGYVFCAVNEESYRKLLSSGTIVYRVTMNDISEKRLIKDLIALQDFEQMAMQKDVIVRPEIITGSVITVTSGPLMGITGIVERRKNDTLITVNVEILGQSVSAVIDIGYVEIEK